MPATDIRISAAEGVRVLTLGPEQNLFNPDFLDRFHAALDEVEAGHDAAGLVTVGEGKYYCNGFDLAYLGSVERAEVLAFVERTCELLARVLTFPLPTVAAVNGHAFGVGAILALAHDQRVMNSERGWLCLPEIELGLQLHPFLQELVVAKAGLPLAADAILGATRFGGKEAERLGLVQEAVAPDHLVEASRLRLDGRLGRGRDITARLKRDLFSSVIGCLGQAQWTSDDGGATP